MAEETHEYLLRDPRATTRLGERLGGLLSRLAGGRAVVLLEGEMGAGKTTFIKGVCAGMGIPPQGVISPTYTLVNVYPGPRSVYHVDLYRLEVPEALLELDRDDWLAPDGLTLIEWPDAARPLLEGEPVLELELTAPDGQPDVRRMRVWATDPCYDPVLAALERLA